MIVVFLSQTQIKKNSKRVEISEFRDQSNRRYLIYVDIGRWLCDKLLVITFIYIFRKTCTNERWLAISDFFFELFLFLLKLKSCVFTIYESSKWIYNIIYLRTGKTSIKLLSGIYKHTNSRKEGFWLFVSIHRSWFMKWIVNYIIWIVHELSF